MRTLKEYQRRESLANGDTYNGLEYDSEIGSADGVKITLFVPKGTTDAVINAAMAEARAQRDVISFRTEEPPPTGEFDAVITMTRDEFIEQFKPIQNGSSINDCLFLPVGDDLAYVVQISNRLSTGVFIWTLMTDDNGTKCILNGYHVVNRLGYYLTEKAPELGKQYSIQDNPSEWCQSKHCDFNEATRTVSMADGKDMRICESCYDAHIIGLNRGMNMIVELPEQIKRSRLADCLMEGRHTLGMVMAEAAGKDFMIGLATGMCQVLNTEPRTLEQLKRALLIKLEGEDR